MSLSLPVSTSVVGSAPASAATSRGSDTARDPAGRERGQPGHGLHVHPPACEATVGITLGPLLLRVLGVEDGAGSRRAAPGARRVSGQGTGCAAPPARP